MSKTPTEELPVYADFPDPRVGRRRPRLEPGLSIDAILRRTEPSNDPARRLVDLGVEDAFASLEAEDAALKGEERRIARLRAETFERVRAVRETEVLLEAREKVMDEREAVLAKRLSRTSPNMGISELERSLKDLRNELSIANAMLSEKERIIAALREEMEELKLHAHSSSIEENKSGEVDYDDVTHKSLAEQVAFLREREAFIEQSENTLFDKAQHLQEWETRLQQDEHDQVTTSDSGNSASEPEVHAKNDPIEFPRVAASR